MDPLRHAIDAAGGIPQVARRLGTTPQAVYNWFRRGHVPTGKIVPVCRATHWRVTPHQVAPDVYPHPCDGIPSEPATDTEPTA